MTFTTSTATVSAQHSHPVEVAENLISSGTGNHDKWLAFSQSSWLEVDFKGVEHTIGAVGFKSANDAPCRDPETIRIECWEDQAWDLAAEINPDWAGARWTEVRHDMEQACTTSKMRFTVSQDNCRATQLGQILFYALQ